jgi:hypothetical protein
MKTKNDPKLHLWIIEKNARIDPLFDDYYLVTPEKQ